MKSPLIKTGLINSYLIYFFVFLLILLAVSIVILASVPPVSKDALTHRLAFPKLYLKYGGIYESQAMHFLYYPMNYTSYI